MLYIPSPENDTYAAFEAWFDRLIFALVPDSKLAEFQRQRKLTPTWVFPSKHYSILSDGNYRTGFITYPIA